MSKDGPSSSWMGFGYQQAREVGAPYRGERSLAAINLDLLITQRPHLRAKTDAMRERGERADAILRRLRNNGDAGHFYAEFYRGPNGEEWAHEAYEDYEAKLRDDIDWGIRHGVYTRVILSHFDPVTKEWERMEEFPRPGISN